MRLRTALSLLAALALAAVAGCGGNGDDDGGREYTTKQVVDHFVAEGGAGLFKSENSSPAADILRVPTDLQPVFGGFEVYVFKPQGGEEALTELLGEDDPDERGIYWRRDQQGLHVAHTKYGANVVVAWFAGEERTVDERWERLHRVMSALEAPDDSGE